MKRFTVAFLTLLTLSINAYGGQGSWRDLTELPRDIDEQCSEKTLPADIVAYNINDMDYLELARKNKTIDAIESINKVMRYGSGSVEDRIKGEISDSGFEVEGNAFTLREQLAKFKELINARIAKLKSAKAFCDTPFSEISILHAAYMIKEKQIAIGVAGLTGFYDGAQKIKGWNFDDWSRDSWSKFIPMSLEDGRQWEGDRAHFIVKEKGRGSAKVAVWFKAVDVKHCAKQKDCAYGYDVIKFEMPFVGENGTRHAYVYNNGKFTRN